jgi:hypothetical protein
VWTEWRLRQGSSLAGTLSTLRTIILTSEGHTGSTDHARSEVLCFFYTFWMVPRKDVTDRLALKGILTPLLRKKVPPTERLLPHPNLITAVKDFLADGCPPGKPTRAPWPKRKTDPG